MRSRAFGRPSAICLFAAIALSLSGCGQGGGDGYGAAGYGYDDDAIMAADVHFNDDAVTNAAPGDALLNFEFVDQSGKTIRPRDFTGKTNLVLVITRGYNGAICPYCSSYTSSLITNYREISQRGAEVVVVYPILRPDHAGRLADFLKSTYRRSSPPADRTPFPVVLDMELKAVNALGIRKDLSKPATYILDHKGQVRFAYVGKSLSDRPSIKVILSQLDALNKDAI